MRSSSAVAEFAVRRPVTVTMLLLASLVLGLIAWARIPLQLMPTGYDFPYLWVWIPYENASPREAERSIVQPVEDALSTLPGLRALESSASPREAEFELELGQDVDMDEAYNGVVDRLERAMGDLPDDVERYWVYRYNPSDEPILWAAVTPPAGHDDPTWFVEQHVVRALERVPGVAKVEHHGQEERRVYVDFDKERIERHGVSLSDLMQRLRSDNTTVPSGDLEEGGRVVLVRSLATWDDVGALKTLPIGGGLVLSDVADIGAGRPASTSIHRVNGEDAASIEVYKESDANTVEVCQGLQEAFDKLQADPRLRGFVFHRFFDQGELIQESLGQLWQAALEGGALAALVLFLFLRQLRLTLVIAAAIPLSFLLTLSLMYFHGETLNLLSLMGLMLSIGNAVDNSIVVVESVLARRERGDDPKTAAIRGTAEVALAITLSTLTNMVVFLPLVLMTDDAQFAFMAKALALPVCWCSVTSLVVALVLVPLGTVRMAPRASLATPEPGRIERAYASILGAVLRRRSTALLAILLVIVSTAWPANHMERTDQMQGGIMDFTVSVRFPRSFTFAEIDRTIATVEGALEKQRAAWGITVLRARRWNGSDRGIVMAMLEKDRTGLPTKEEVLEQLKDHLPEIPGVETWIGWQRGEGSGNSVDIALVGDDSEVLVRLGDEVKTRLESMPGVLSVEAEVGEGGADELRVHVDRARAAQQGVPASFLARAVSFGFRGTLLPPMRDGPRELPVQAGFRVEDRRDLADLEDFTVPGARGGVALGAVAETSLGKGYGRIRRMDRKTSLAVRIEIEGDDLGAVRQGIGQQLSSLQLPRGYTWNPGRRFEKIEEQDRAMTFALLMSIAYVFLLMGMLFESFWLPLSVLLSIPVAMVGVFWALYLWKTPFEVMSGIGLVVLVGIVVNNAIVLVDRVQQNRDAGFERTEAVLLAGKERLRPILMTALTTIVGLLPMALGDAGIVGIPYYPLGRTLMGGMVAGTLLTLVIVPLFYTYFDDLRAMLQAGLRWEKSSVAAGVVGFALLLPAGEPRAEEAQGAALPGPAAGAPATVTSDLGEDDPIRSNLVVLEGLGELPSDAAPLSLSEAVERAVGGNLGVRVRAVQLRAAQARTVAAHAPFVPWLFGSTRLHPWRSERYFDQYKSWERKDGFDGNYTLGVGAALPTGTRLTFGFSQGTFEQQTTYDPEVKVENPLDPDRPFEILVNNEFATRWAAISLNLRQSLLQGIAPSWNLQGLHRAELAEELGSIDHQAQIARVAADALSAYWDLVAAIRLVEIARIDVRLAEDQRTHTRARIGAGELARIELLRIDEQVASREAERIEAERQRAEAAQRIVLLMAAEAQDPLWTLRIRPLASEGPTFSTGVLEERLGQARRFHADLRRLRVGAADKELELARLRHELLPDLALDTTLNLDGSGFTATEALADVGQQRFPDFTVGLDLTVPLPDLSAIAGMQAARHDLDVAALQVEEAERAVFAAVQTQVRLVEASQRQVEVAAVRIELAEKSADAAEATYRAGRNTLSEVLQAHKALKDARRAAVLAKVAQDKAAVELEVLCGTLLETLGIRAE